MSACAWESTGFRYYGSKLGVGHKTGIDLPSEEPGLMPSAEWVERVLHRKWYAGETISVATGQGAVTTTPLQLARMIGGIASGGVFKQPHLLKDAQNVGEERFPISESTVEKITDAMYGVVNESGGTGGHLRLAGIELSGKSGTAQVIGYDTRARVGKAKEIRRQRLVRRIRAEAQSGNLSSPFWCRKAASTAAKQPVRSSRTSSRPTTTRRTGSRKANSPPRARRRPARQPGQLRAIPAAGLKPKRLLQCPRAARATVPER